MPNDPKFWPFLDYHEQASAQGQNVEAWARSDSSTWPAEWKQVAHKAYDGDAVQLPTSDHHSDILANITARRSQRMVSGAPLLLAELSTLLRASLGVRLVDGCERRPYPSPGALYSLEWYAVVRRCDGLQPGIYHYEVTAHALERMRSGLSDSELRASFGAEWIVGSRVLLICTTAWSRLTPKYGARAYRYALIEAGHAAQNLLLAATSSGLPAVPVGGFADAMLTRHLGLANHDELPIYAVVFP